MHFENLRKRRGYYCSDINVWYDGILVGKISWPTAFDYPFFVPDKNLDVDIKILMPQITSKLLKLYSKERL